MVETVQFYSGLDLGKQSDFTAFVIVQRKRLTVPPLGHPAMGNQTEHKMFEGTVRQAIRDKVKNLTKPRELWKYKIRHIERFDLGTPYPVIGEKMARAFLLPPMRGTSLSVDKTGVGDAVCDYLCRDLRQPIECPYCAPGSRLIKVIPSSDGSCGWCHGTKLRKPSAHIRPIMITGGTGASEDGAGFKVSKKELVSVMQVLLQSKRLVLPNVLKYWRGNQQHEDKTFGKVLVDELNNFKVKITQAGNESFEAWREREHDDVVLSLAMALWVAEGGSKQLWIR
jgi:hypothetical protein